MKRSPIENLQILLRCLGAGDTDVFESPNGDYYAIQCKDSSILPEGCKQRNIISRLQYEIYGEYPLSQTDHDDWNLRVSKAFNIQKPKP